MSNVLHQHTVVKLLEIDAGHRVYGHEGKCASCHGHHYRFEIHAQPQDGLDKVGRVIDFSQIKAVIGTWLDENWDHGMILWAYDPIAKLWSDRFDCGTDDETNKSFWIPGELHGQKLFLLPDNPTAENLASYLLTLSNQKMSGLGITVTKVVCWETPTCCGIAEL